MMRKMLCNLILGLMLLAVTSCAETAYLEQRLLWGIDCRPEKLVNGHCVAAK
jgi:hypothetical protein